MQDIARAAGVSQSTVSRVLNDTPTPVPIAGETRERVHEVAQRLCGVGGRQHGFGDDAQGDGRRSVQFPDNPRRLLLD
ncbi:MAG: helix-turn-helix domain-containing protein, partial [Acidimicrobiia bacterium]